MICAAFASLAWRIWPTDDADAAQRGFTPIGKNCFLNFSQLSKPYKVFLNLIGLFEVLKKRRVQNQLCVASFSSVCKIQHTDLTDPTRLNTDLNG